MMMSDYRVRVQERDAAGGDADAGARLLQGLTRAGRLPRSQLALLATLGDPAAVRLLGQEALPQPTLGARWARRLEPWGKEVCVRVAVAAAREALRQASCKPHVVQQAIAETEAWVLCPCAVHLRLVARTALQAARSSQRQLGMAAFTAANAAASVNGTMWSAWYAGRAVAYAESLGLDGFRDAVRSELVPWILQSRDPLRERA